LLTADCGFLFVAYVLAEVVGAQFAAFDNTLERADGDRFAAVVRDNYLGAAISDGCPFVPPSRSRGGARRELHPSHRRWEGAGPLDSDFNQPGGFGVAESRWARTRVPALLGRWAMASSSVSPADAQPGSSGKTEE
jgi:hypothetical protein